ncbi:uncharacterized protein [Mycetomoellerius zeteki]|uniref:uncharacterized protein n=1 Tax=Mycetomoellerius zeteki TaxID=64791 RepID=UPI00084E63B5|nr:PREDICTED: uncharacterized protein LOC108726489 [Trachymyrmex zeteki]
MDLDTEKIRETGNFHTESTLEASRKFKLRSSLAKKLSNLAFLNRCRDNNIIPKFLQLKDHLGTHKSKNILQKTSLILIKERIHFTESQIAQISHKTFKLHLLLSATLRHDIWQTLDRITYEQATKTLTQSSERQKQKYMNLVPHKKPQPSLLNVKNLFNKDLSQDTISALAKDPNFAVAPRKFQKEEIISQIESIIYRLPAEQADNIRRQDISNILSKAKTPPPNTTRQERLTLQDLNRDADIIVLPADKGNATVVMNTSDYKKKMKNLLSDKAYKMLDKDPTNRIAQNTKILVEISKIPNEAKPSLKPTNPLPPRLYGL